MTQSLLFIPILLNRFHVKIKDEYLDKNKQMSRKLNTAETFEQL